MPEKKKDEDYEIIDVTEIIDKVNSGIKLSPREQEIYDDIDFTKIVLDSKKGITFDTKNGSIIKENKLKGG